MATYTAAKSDVIAPGSFAATELLSKMGGFFAGCGQAALAVLIGATKGRILSAQDVTTLIKESVNAHVTVGKLAASGESAPSTLEYLAKQNGVELSATDWRSALTFAGQRDVILGVSNASAFGGSNANVQGHYITVVGVQGSNYIVSDPNTPQSINGGYVVYTPQQIANSQPFWAAVPTQLPGSVQSSQLGIPNTGIGLPNITIPGLSGIADFVKTLSGWFNPPTRALKFLVGLALMWTAILLAFLPDIAAGAASATGNPEVGAAILSSQRGPKGLAGAGIRSAGTLAGRQRTATKQEFRAQRATATVRLKQQTQAQQAQARTMERAQATARRAATTTTLNRQTTAYNVRGTSGSPKPSSAEMPERPPSTSRNEYSPRVNSGKAGFGGYGVGDEPAPRAKRTRKAQAAEGSKLEAVARSRGETVGEFLKLPVSERKKAIETYNLGATTTRSKKPIPDSRVRRVVNIIRRRGPQEGMP